MFTVSDLSISLSRGDTASLEVAFDGDVPAAGDTVIISLKRTASTKEPLWEKQAEADAEGVAVFHISAADTASLSFGTYYWDIRVFYADGQVTTPFAPQPFEIVEVIGNDREP